MSKTIKRFETRQMALDFAKKNKIPFKEVRKIKRENRVFYRLIVTDAVYKRWVYSLKNKPD